MNITPSHINSVSADGVIYIPPGQAPGVDSEALLSVHLFSPQSGAILLGRYTCG